jgi:topoisomerase-4 subunit B
VVDVVSKMNTGGKYDSLALKIISWFKWCRNKSSQCAINYFRVESVRDTAKAAEFSAGIWF